MQSLPFFCILLFTLRLARSCGALIVRLVTVFLFPITCRSLCKTFFCFSEINDKIDFEMKVEESPELNTSENEENKNEVFGFIAFTVVVQHIACLLGS